MLSKFRNRKSSGKNKNLRKVNKGFYCSNCPENSATNPFLMKQYVEQICSNDISVHNIFPILGIHATSKTVVQNSDEYVTLCNYKERYTKIGLLEPFQLTSKFIKTMNMFRQYSQYCSEFCADSELLKSKTKMAV